VNLPSSRNGNIASKKGTMKRQKSVYLIETKNLSPKQRPVSERKKTISRNSRKIRENGKTAAFPNGMEKKP